MEEILKLGIGMLILILGIPIGNLLANQTKEELKSGQRWFGVIILVGLLGAVICAIIRNDFLMFSFLFLVIVTSRSLKRPVNQKRKY